MACGAPHPEYPDLHCTATSGHAEHVAWRGTGRDREPVDWPNTDYRPPASSRTGRAAAQSRLLGLADLVPPKQVSPDPRRPVGANTIAIGHAHPETSVAMAARVLPKTGTQRRLVYDLALDRGEQGITDDEIEVALGMLHQSASAARNSLMNDGWLADSGLRRRTRSGFEAIAWVAVPGTAGLGRA